MRYTLRNEAEIVKLDPALQVKVRQLLEALEMIAEDVLIVSGRRTSAEQDRLYAQGRTEPGSVVTHLADSNSFHVHGVAIDVVPVGPLGVPLEKRFFLEWAGAARYENIAREAQKIGFSWGFHMWGFDKPHFEYTQGITITAFKKGRKLDTDTAKSEWRHAIKERIKIAERAIASPAVVEGRRKELREFVKMMKRKMERL